MGEIFYHGSSKLFHKFDLDYALQGTGKVKFGFGLYVTSSFTSAAHYSKGAAEERHYVYTVEVCKKNKLNYISYLEEVGAQIVHQAEVALGERIPQLYTINGKVFRKYLGIRLVRSETVWKKLAEATRLDENKLRVGLDEEKAVAEFLCKIGVKFIEWPFTWIAGETRMNRAYLKASFLKIIRIEEVKLDAKNQYIEGSNILVKDLSVSPHRLASYVQTYYPQYWGIQEYESKECVLIHKVTEEWGIFCNFAPTQILVNGVMFKT